MGYYRAGFDVVGVDIAPQPHYPFRYWQMDALESFCRLDPEVLEAQGFDAIHASPPCQSYSTLGVLHGKVYPELVEPVRDLLIGSGLPYVIENVLGAPLHNAVTLCGSEFQLTTRTLLHGQVWLKRHRLFESNVFLWSAGGCHCHGKLTVPVYGHGGGGNRQKMRGAGVAQASREVMGIDWMTRAELDQAIPPAYTEFIGAQIMAHLKAKAAA